MNKVLKLGFLVFSLFAVIFGVIQLSQNLKITVPLDDSGQTNQVAEFDEAKLRVLDTDEDGLTDWEELNVHGTSPYLADSDSDGTSDREEIALATDPNCPQGRVCGSEIIQVLEDLQEQGYSEPVIEELDPVISDAPLVQDFSSDSQAALDALEAGTTPTPSQIRSLLQDSGIPAEQLVDTSDEDLIQLFLEVAEQTPTQ